MDTWGDGVLDEGYGTVYICRKCLELNDKINKCLLVWKVRKGAGWLTSGFLHGAVV